MCWPPPPPRRRTTPCRAAADLLVARSAEILGGQRRRRRPGRGRRRVGHGRSTGCASPTPASRAWPVACARWPACPTRWARCSTAGCGPTACASPGCGCRSAWWRSSTRTAPTSPPTPPACASSRATPRSCGARRARISSNIAIAAVLREAVAKAGLPADAVILVDDTSRETAVEFMQLRESIDCLIPRGGPSLIRVDPRQRHRALRHRRRRQLPRLRRRRRRPRHGARHHRERQDPAPVGVQRGRVAAGARGGGRRSSCPGRPRPLAGVELRRRRAHPRAGAGAPAGRPTRTWSTEFLDLQLAVKVVARLDEAIDHIATLRLGPHRGHRHPTRSRPPTASPPRSTPPPWW